MRTISRQCKGKVRYAYKEQANAAAAYLRKKRFGRYHAYKCKFCGGFHVGHKGVSKRRRW